MQGLENFLCLMLASPYLRADATLRMFLTTVNNAEFEQGKKAHTSGMGADPASNLGLRCVRTEGAITWASCCGTAVLALAAPPL